MAGETQGQSHQISNFSIGPDGFLYVHMGDGFDAATAQNLNSFRGKILRLNFDGTPVDTNPFYDAGDGITSRDYVYAYGVRNPFGGAWRASDAAHYIVENGPSVDRITRLVAGRNYLWSGTNQSMQNFAIYNWAPSTGPVNIAFTETATWGGGGFPAGKMDHAFITESGPTWATGPQANGKRITEWVFDSSGNLVSGPVNFVTYNGSGKASVVAITAGPDGLYFSDFYKDLDFTSPIDRGARILRVRFVGSADFTADVTAGDAPLTVQFTDTSTVASPSAWMWDFGDFTTSAEQHPQHTYNADGTYTVQLQVTGAEGVSTLRKIGYVVVGEPVTIALIGGAIPPSTSDAAIASHLTQIGYTVTVYDDEPANRPSAAQIAADFDLVVISSTVLSSNIGDQFRNLAIPLIHWESALNTIPRIPLSDQGGTTSGQSITVLDNSHPVTAGLPLGAVNVFNSSATMSFGNPSAGPDVAVLAHRTGDINQYAVMAVDTGGEMLNGYFAPARRVFLFLQDSSWLATNAVGKQIFEQAVLWMAGPAQNPPTIVATSPFEGETIVGDTVEVEWAVSGDLSAADHVHVQLDAGPIQMINFAGSATLTGVTPGPHIVTVWLVNSSHQALPNLEATDTVSFFAREPVPVSPDALPLAYNWNGVVHRGEGGDADVAQGYRSIGDRGLILGQADSLGGGAFDVVSGALTYSLASAGMPALDCVMLGARRPGGGTAWDDADDSDSLGIPPIWDPTTGSGDVAGGTHPLTPSDPLDGDFEIGLLFNASNGGADFDVTLGFTDASSVTVTLNAPDWFADDDHIALPPAGGVASQALLPGPLSGGDGFAGANTIDAANPGEPLNVVEARITADSLLTGADFDVSGRQLSSITFDNVAGGSTAAVAIFAASMTQPTCDCPGDLTHDSVVDGDDIQMFVACLLGGEGGECLCADVDGLPGVDSADVAAFAALLTTGAACP
jgi:PKD repeat protein